MNHTQADFNWDDHWDDYDAAAQSNPAQRMRHEFIVSVLLNHRANSTYTHLLDIGSGQGDMLAKIRQKLPLAKLAGFELSESGVEISKRKVPDAALVVADLFQPNPLMEPFHNWATHATCCEVLEHLDDPISFLKASSQYLSTGAKIIITVPSGPMSLFDKHIGHRQHFSQNSISQVIQASGFEVSRVYRIGFPFFNLYRLTVIARGANLIEDVRTGDKGSPGKFALSVMAAYRLLFRFNLKDSPWGWQLAVLARKIQ